MLKFSGIQCTTAVHTVTSGEDPRLSQWPSARRIREDSHAWRHHADHWYILLGEALGFRGGLTSSWRQEVQCYRLWLYNTPASAGQEVASIVKGNAKVIFPGWCNPIGDQTQKESVQPRLDQMYSRLVVQCFCLYNIVLPEAVTLLPSFRFSRMNSVGLFLSFFLSPFFLSSRSNWS